jgi:hypothetical protein
MASNFICAAGDSVMIRFPKTRSLSVSSTHTIRSRDWGTEKVGSLKDFEIRSVQEKELPTNRSTYINPIGTIICPRQKKKIMQLLNIVWSGQSSKQSINIIYHTESNRAIPLWDSIDVRIREDIHSVQVNVHHELDRNKTTTITMLKLLIKWLMLSQWSNK